MEVALVIVVIRPHPRSSFWGGIFVKIRVNSVTLFPLLLQRTGPLSVTLRLLGLFLFWFRVGRSTCRMNPTLWGVMNPSMTGVMSNARG